jgi:4-diphosphocytidyl-2-C-methyl-D-erythritol kinase
VPRGIVKTGKTPTEMMEDPVLFIQSPAKVNLRLEVLSKRSDGYHNIRSVMVPIDLSDRIHIVLTEDGAKDVTCTQVGVPHDERNLAYRAACLILDQIGEGRGFRINIKKKIPVGAGLGGGSSNAASTLLGLNRLLGSPLTSGDLMEIATHIGADVPFFILGRPALATGMGERLEALRGLPRFWFILVFPGISVSTRWAYDRLKLWLTRPRDHTNIPAFSWDVGTLGRFLHNDLERVVFESYPILQWIKQRLLGVGAAASLMSGSGSTVYGVFLARAKAQEAWRQLKGEFACRDWGVFLARSIGY